MRIHPEYRQTFTIDGTGDDIQNLTTTFIQRKHTLIIRGLKLLFVDYDRFLLLGTMS